MVVSGFGREEGGEVGLTGLTPVLYLGCWAGICVGPRSKADTHPFVSRNSFSILNVPKNGANVAMEAVKGCDALLALGSSVTTMSAFRLVRNWDIIKWGLTFIRDFTDGSFVPVATLVGLLGFVVDFPVTTVEKALFWRVYVSFASLAILLWLFAVAGALLGSMLARIFLSFYAAAVAYQESSFYFRLCYIVAALSIYDEYNNFWTCMKDLAFQEYSTAVSEKAGKAKAGIGPENRAT
ncbi:hypothetical protein CTI12_AA554980 [Artemisia annua]|uniref:Uncharacterized protein n=1 Tax=Artemisia annua TaxID=35608 RepID=A0A2U1KWB7_ARTAN|nr:hypothetical protein CTI12_AA554980 [Artemisia annua]